MKRREFIQRGTLGAAGLALLPPPRLPLASRSLATKSPMTNLKRCLISCTAKARLTAA